jgi:Tol biopolymer transport system component
LARRLDLGRLELVGDPVTVAEDLWFDPAFSGRINVSASRDGTLVFRTGGMEQSELVWLDREGALLGKLGEPGSHVGVALSDDGRRVAFSRAEPESEQRRAWLYSLDTQTASQLTFDGDGISVAFSPDGERLAVSTSRGGGIGIEELTPGGSSRTLVAEVPGRSEGVNDWAPDGRHLLVTRGSSEGLSLVLHDLEGGQETNLLSEGGNFLLGAVSPDGRWLAYTSDITGEYEVYVARLDDPSQFQRVSSSGGQQPRWNPSGKELFFLRSDRTLMAVPILKDDTAFEWSPPRPLFKTGVHDLGPLSLAATYDVAPGGQRFLVSRRLPQGPDPAAAIVHWSSLVEAAEE